MRVTVSITAPSDALEQDLLTLDLPASMTVADLKALIQSETNLSNSSQQLFHNGQLLSDDTKTLEEVGIGDGEMLAMHVRNRTPGGAGGAGGAAARGRAAAGAGPSAGRRTQQGPDPELIRLQILGDPNMRTELRNQNPELAQAVENPERFREMWYGLQRQQAEAEMNRQREIALLNDDPFNVEAQAKIEEMIRQEQVMENLQSALEHNPEAFGKVHMLYIDVEVNGHHVKAFVDSGAQATIMSPSCAEKCGIMRLVDKRFAGVARGVGTAQILGRVHAAPIKIGTLFLPSSFTVMEGKDVELLLGLDMLKRHQACIDLRQNKLIIQDVEVPFLGEADIPKFEEEHLLNEPTVEGPGGAKLGGRSGAVVEPGSSAPASGASESSNFRGPGRTLSEASSSGPQSSQTTPAAPSSQPGLSQRTSSFPPESIAQLQQLGFSREDAIAALEAAGGNLEFAAGLLWER